MKRSLRILGTVVLVAVQVLAVCFVVDFFFRKYEKDYVYSYASLDADSYSLEKMLLNDNVGEVHKRKPRDEYRILVFGDSFTFAVTKAQYSFCAVLEKKLNAMGLDRPVRVVNLGFPSISFPDYLERFAFWSQALDYDAVIFNVYLGNDFNDVRNTPLDAKAFAEKLTAHCSHGMAYGPYTLVPHEYWFRFMDFIKAQVLFKLQSDNDLRRMLFLPDLNSLGVMPDTVDPRYSSLLPLTPDQMASEMRSSMKPFFKDTMFAYKNALPWYEVFLATAAKVAASGKPVMLMVSPPLSALSPEVGKQAAKDLGEDPAKADFALPLRITRTLAKDVGLPQDDILDLTTRLAPTTPDGQGTYTGRDTHWSPEGNAWVGDILADWVASHWFGRAAAKDAPAQPAPAFEDLSGVELPSREMVRALADQVAKGCAGR